MKIIIGGDLVPTDSNKNLFENGNLLENLDKNFLKYWNSADFRLFNLECPICDNLKPIDKFGPNLFCNKKTINGIKELKPDLVLLSNNHILDYGIDGLNSTLNILNKNDISFSGIIENKFDNNKVFIFDKNNIKVGIYNICDNEFSIANSKSKGAANLNILKNYKEISEAKTKCDYLVLIYHGGKELYRYPSPNLKNLCEYFIEIGADIVICQHSHCIGCKEEYNNGTIIYGQGNFIFDTESNEYLNSSLLINIDFQKEKYDIQYIPIERDNNLIKVSTDTKILNDFNLRSKEITSNEFIEKQFNDFALNKLNGYFKIFGKANFITKILNKFVLKNYYIKRYNKKYLLKILNIIECEAHRETIISALKEYIINKQ